MRAVAIAVILVLLAGPPAAAFALSVGAGTPEVRLAGWEEACFRAPFSYENTRCFDACAEQIARMKAEEAAAKKRAEEAAAAKAAAQARRVSTKRTISANSDAAWVKTYPLCGKCGKKHLAMRNIVTGKVVPTACGPRQAPALPPIVSYP